MQYFKGRGGQMAYRYVATIILFYSLLGVATQLSTLDVYLRTWMMTSHVGLFSL